MQISLNEKQTEKLSGFFMDMAKGLMLGGLGLAMTNEAKFLTISVSTFLSLWFVKASLDLLKEKYV